MRIPLSREVSNGALLTVIFDQQASQLLFWSLTGAGPCTPDQWHTIRRAVHVAGIGDRG